MVILAGLENRKRSPNEKKKLTVDNTDSFN